MSINTSNSFKDSAREIREAFGEDYRLLADYFEKFAVETDFNALADIEQEFVTVSPERLSDPAFLDSDYQERFLMLISWFVQKYRIFHSLGLHQASKTRILDLGSGGGHFLALSQFAGHDCVGLDEENPLFAKLCELMNVRREVSRIEPETALPALGQFDLVTAQNIAFHKLQDRFWNEQEWLFLIKDITDNLLSPQGQLLLHFKSDTSPEEGGLNIEDKSLPRFLRQLGAMFLEDDSGLEVTYFAIFNDLARLRQKLLMFG